MEKIIVNHRTALLGIMFLMMFSSTFAQLSPPGLGKAKTASWFAFGVQQALDSLKQKESTTYVGLGFKSNPDDHNPLSKMAILVINEEISNHYAEHWTYSYALSYRRSNLYDAVEPYQKLSPAIEQEFRVYGRYSYLLGGNGFKWKNTIRQEFRKFYNPDFSATDENFQFRTRLKTQINIDLGTQKTHQLIASAEALFAISKENYPENRWSKFSYKESRIGLYYALTPPKIPFTFHVGYMHNIIGKSDLVDVNYIAFDVVWKNPFKY